MSSASAITRDDLVPGAGSSSYRVTTGPGRTLMISPLTPKSSSVPSSSVGVLLQRVGRDRRDRRLLRLGQQSAAAAAGSRSPSRSEGCASRAMRLPGFGAAGAGPTRPGPARGATARAGAPRSSSQPASSSSCVGTAAARGAGAAAGRRAPARGGQPGLARRRRLAARARLVASSTACRRPRLPAAARCAAQAHEAVGERAERDDAPAGLVVARRVVRPGSCAFGRGSSRSRRRLGRGVVGEAEAAGGGEAPGSRRRRRRSREGRAGAARTAP